MSTRLAERPIERILIVSLDNLGDLVFASALAPPLAARFPRATIDVWCKAYTADVARLIPHVHEVVASDPFWDRAPGRGKGTFTSFLRSAARVRRSRYDVAVLAAARWRTAAAVAATGIPVRIGVAHRKNRPFLTRILPPEDIERPVLSEMARLLEPFGSTDIALRYRLDPSRLEARVERLARRLQPRFVALHPFASKRDRCVPLPEWVDLAHMLEARGLPPLWIGSRSELAELRALGGPPSWRHMDEVGDGTLTDSAAALWKASAFAGHDSGPLHVAGALGVPVLGIFAPGEPLRTFPQGVGPSRMIARSSPGEINADDMLRELETLVPELAPGD